MKKSELENQLKELARRADQLLDEVLPQAGQLSLDIGNVNELAMLTTKVNKQFEE